MHYLHYIFLIAQFLSLLLTCVFSKHKEETLTTNEKWAFLDRFCFLSDDGTFYFDIEYYLEDAPMSLLLYYDSSTQWPAVYKSNKTCEERKDVMKQENNQIINLTQADIGIDCEVQRDAKEKSYYHCRGSRSFKSSRERWWFIAISKCDSAKGLRVKYTLTMTNGYSYWFKHFSADEFYILQTDLVVLALQIGLFFLSLLAAAELKNRQLFHTTYRLYMFILVLQILGIAFGIFHYSRYGYDGIGLNFCKLIGQIFQSASTIMMILLLLLMAKGFSITRGRLRQASAIKLTIFMCLYSVTYVTLFIYEQNFFDPAEVLYIYESPAGYGLVSLRAVAWCMFFYACFFSVKHYPEKASFYYPFFAFYTLWFLAGPVVIIINNHVIDKWVREKVANGVQLSISLLGHLFFLYLTRPSAANKNFPYHVRTSQIMDMEASMTGRGPGGTLDAFSSHTYAPEYIEPPKNYVNNADLFLVSGAVEMIPINGPRTILKQDQSYPHHSPGFHTKLFTRDGQPRPPIKQQTFALGPL